MALPAGRYGVTKRQLNKIKNLPVNTIGMIEAAVEDVTDLMEDTVGWISNNKYDGDDVTVDKSTSITSVTHELNGGFVEGKKYKLSFNISAISGFELATTLRVQIYKTGSTSTKILPPYQITQTVGIKEIDFIAESTQSDCTLQLYIQSSETGENAAVTFTDISITHLSVEEEVDLKADISALGTNEVATASRLYHPGEHFYKDGKFCTVIGSADVASGATWTLNTNYVEGTIAELLKTQKASFNYTQDVSSLSACYVRKFGKIVCGQIQFKIASTTLDTSITCFTLPEKFRPISLYNTVTHDVGDSKTTESHDVSIDTNGVCNIILRNVHSSIRWVAFEFCYITN